MDNMPDMKGHFIGKDSNEWIPTLQANVASLKAQQQTPAQAGGLKSRLDDHKLDGHE